MNTLLDGGLAAGLNEINSVQFGVKDLKHYRDEARNKAIDNAKEQVEVLAAGFNVKLGKVYSINYRAPDATPYPMPRMKAMNQMGLLLPVIAIKLTNNRVLILPINLMLFLN